MAITILHYGIIIFSLILLFAFIHLAVSSSIINVDHRYKNMFRPEIGLSAYNIIISILGIFVGALGLFCLLKKREDLSKIVIIISGILGILTFLSLITALIINSKSGTFLSTRFSSNMYQYSTNSNARSIIDNIQTDFTCCGEAMWLDWARVQSGITTVPTTTLPATTESSEPVVDTTTPTTPVVDTTAPMTPVVDTTAPTTPVVDTTAPMTPVTDASAPMTPVVDASTPMTPVEDSSTILSNINMNVRREINQFDLLSDPLTLTIRQRRQAGSVYDNMISVSYSDQFFVPTTCCINGASNSSQATCTSPSQFYAYGCLRTIVRRSNKQNMGIGIINCFMIVLAILAILFLLHYWSTSDIHERNSHEPQLGLKGQFNANFNKSPPIINSYH